VRAPAAHVHVHIARGDQRHVELHADGAKLREPRHIVGPAVQFHRKPRAVREHPLGPRAFRGIRGCGRKPQGQQSVVRCDSEILAQQSVRTLVCAPPRQRQQLAKPRVTLRGFDQQDQLGAVRELHFATHDQAHAGFARSFQCAHDAGQ
jgi:hypothetical protein